MRKYFIKNIMLAAVVMLAIACQKDEQNFNYEKLTEVSIKSENTSYTVVQLDTLVITPELVESTPSGDGYSYQWKIYSQLGNEEPVILSKEKDLKAAITLSPGQYNMQYKVTNNTTGVSSFLLYSVLVNGAFYEGWMVVANRGANAELSFIRSDDEVFLKPAESINGKVYPGRALSAYAAIDFNIKLTLFFTDQGVYRFNADDFLENGTTTSIFPGGGQFSGKPVYGLSKSSMDQYIINNGGLHASVGPVFYPANVLDPYSERFSGDYALFPAIISTSSNFTYFYDNKYKRFMESSYLSRSLDPSPATAGANFNMADVGMTMIASDYGVQSGLTDEFYFVMQNSSGNRFLYAIGGADGSTPMLSQAISNSPDIGLATSFAMSGAVKHLYYAAGNKIYLYDIPLNSSKLVYTFPGGSEISDLKMLRSTSRRIVAAVNHGTAGDVYYFDLDNLGNVIGNTYVNKFEGFGQIVGLSYRQP